MKCYICKLYASQNCDKCKKPTCPYQLIKSYPNRKSKRAVAKHCEKCFEKVKKKP